MMGRVADMTASGPWTVRVWQGTTSEPERTLLAEGRVTSLPAALNYAITTDAAATVDPTEYVWVEATSPDNRYVCTFDSDSNPSPWVAAPRRRGRH